MHIDIPEQLKLLDETKVSFYKNAVDMSKSRIDQVKRVVVAVKSSETEKVPEAFSEREGNFYLVEFFPQAGSMSRARTDDRYERSGRGGGRGNDRGRPGGGRGGNDRGSNDRGGERSERAPRADRPARNATSTNGGPSPFVVNPADPNFKPQGERKPRTPRAPKAPRGPRPERAPREHQGPKGAAELRLVLKGFVILLNRVKQKL